MSASSVKSFFIPCGEFHQPPVKADPEYEEIMNGVLIYNYNFECCDHALETYKHQRKDTKKVQAALRAKWQRLIDKNRKRMDNEYAEGPAKIAKLQKLVLGFEDYLEDQREEENENLEELLNFYERRWGPDFLETRGRASHLAH